MRGLRCPLGHETDSAVCSLARDDDTHCKGRQVAGEPAIGPGGSRPDRVQFSES
jgi:hypothetical protein